MLALVATAAPVAPARAEPAPATESERRLAEAVVTAWLAAQNQRDWKGYQRLYAARFTGIRRVGTVEKKLDRAKWMADRKAMFKAAMAVTADGITVTSDAVELIVTFVQTWEQGAFADAGHKRLVLDLAAVRAGTAGVIVAEEMVTSQVVLNQLGCLRLHYPAAPASGKRVDKGRTSDTVAAIEILEIGPRYACRVDTHPAGDPSQITVEIAVVERAAKWKLLGGALTEVITRSKEGELEHAGQVVIGPLLFTPAEPVLQVSVAATETTPYSNKRDDAVALYRITSVGLDELITYKSTSASDAEDSTGTDCGLVIETSSSKGYPDLTVACAQRHPGDWWNEDPSKRGQEVTTTTTRYRWNGTNYEER